MARHRSITTAALAALALCVPAAAAHASSTLLSGYGGPGQGNQALIGSTLIGAGAGAGGKGGGGGAGRSEASSSPSSSAVAPPASIALPSHPAASQRPPGANPGHAVKPATAPDRSRTTAPAYSQASASIHPSGGGGALGLSGSDVAYMALAFTVLVLTALLTARVAGRAGRADGAQ